MSESKLHKELVKTLILWVNKHVDCDDIILLADIGVKDKLPFVIRYCRPDIYASSRYGSNKIIGEAKTTLSDLESEHTIKQLEEYIQYCLNNKCKLLIATPYDLKQYAKGKLASVMRDGVNVSFEIISPLDVM
jgi:hypothetical protein